MTPWKLTLTYDGSLFHGWQVQPTLPTIQGALAAAIAQTTGETVLPQGSGRTDAGVHALAQIVTFTLEADIPAANLTRALNRALPPSIRVLSSQEVPESFHARHSALRKSYEYRIHERRFPSSLASDPDRICSPFLAPTVWDCRWTLDLAAMQQAAALLLGTHDFTSFSAADPDLTTREALAGSVSTPGPNPVKTLYTSTITREPSALGAWPTSLGPKPTRLLIYRVTGSGFLHHMVRNLVGTLVEIGRGALTPASLPEILAARNRTAAGPTAPASGLSLVNVEYPETDHTETSHPESPAAPAE